MSNKNLTLTPVGGNKYAVTDNETGFVLTFLKGRFNTSQKTIPPASIPPDVKDPAAWSAAAMRRIGDFVATEHPELLTFSNEELAKRQRFLDIMADTGAAIRELREAQELTIDEAAAAARITPERWQRLEAGKLADNYSVLIKFIESIGGRFALVLAEGADDPHCQFIEFED